MIALSTEFCKNIICGSFGHGMKAGWNRQSCSSDLLYQIV